MDYILCKQCNQKEMGQCKVVTGERGQRALNGRMLDDSGGDKESKGGAEAQMAEAAVGTSGKDLKMLSVVVKKQPDDWITYSNRVQRDGAWCVVWKEETWCWNENL